MTGPLAVRRPGSDVGSPRELLGSSPSMRELADLIEVLARSDDATVLILGERGTGKGCVARMIHALSRRAHGPYVEATCVPPAAGRAGARAPATSTSELLALAAGGTLFLDEIADLEAAAQPELLRALERGAEGAGGAPAARLVAATHRDLVGEVNETRFREDLYYRLSAMPVYLPPLRARPREDVAEVARAALAALRADMPGSPAEIADDALDALARYSWPGNLRELRTVLERALIAARERPRVEREHLPVEVRESGGAAPAQHVPRTLEEVERMHVERTLRAHAGNRTHAARELGISRATLIKKAKEYGV